MSDVVNGTLFTLDSICWLAGLVFTKSIFETTRVIVAQSFRDSIAHPDNDTYLFRFLDLSRQVTRWPRIGIISTGWAISLIAFLIRQSKALSGFEESTMTIIANTCDIATVAVTVLIPTFAAILFFHPQNKHFGFS